MTEKVLVARCPDCTDLFFVFFPFLFFFVLPNVDSIRLTPLVYAQCTNIWEADKNKDKSTHVQEKFVFVYSRPTSLDFRVITHAKLNGVLNHFETFSQNRQTLTSNSYLVSRT